MGGLSGSTTRGDTEEDVVAKIMHHLPPDCSSSVILALSVASIAMLGNIVLSLSGGLHR